MDIHKAAAWANVGSFPVACIALYLVWRSQHPQTVGNGTAAQPVTYFHWSMWVFLAVLIFAGGLQLVAALIQSKKGHRCSAPH
jgi:hypothetical protein